MSEELIILLVVAAYVLQAVIGGLVARRRGKSFWFWFAVCFLIIPPHGLDLDAHQDPRRMDALKGRG